MTASPIIEARGLSLATSTGRVYSNVDLSVPAGALAIVVGPARSGKTALLLTLAGRMVPSSGELRVAGVEGRRRAAVRRLVGLGEFRSVNDLDESLTVTDQVRAELALHGRHWRGVRADSVLGTLCRGLDPHTLVSKLGAADRLLLGAALGMVGDPPVLVLDELDGETTPKERLIVLEALRCLTTAGTTVVAGALDPALAREADVALYLDTSGRASSFEPAQTDTPISEVMHGHY